MPYLLLAIVAVIAVGLIFLKANTALVFLALCAGDVLLQFANKNIAYINGHLNNHLLPQHFTVSHPTLEILVLIIPAALVAVFTKRSHGLSKWVIQLPPAIATGVVGVLLAVPLLPANTQLSITQAKYWGTLGQYQVPLVFICVLVVIVVVILGNIMPHGSKKHHS